MTNQRDGEKETVRVLWRTRKRDEGVGSGAAPPFTAAAVVVMVFLPEVPMKIMLKMIKDDDDGAGGRHHRRRRRFRFFQRFNRSGSVVINLVNRFGCLVRVVLERFGSGLGQPWFGSCYGWVNKSRCSVSGQH
ncbi:hypothetical protein HanRHA438_Chr02g0062051 [Helianthus annuus]|nr:hypothetical protein HanHA300_Chr02g0049611 [Helianthus annuus]KAJ0618452.1 hypothetical protein HanHA89_Chr02g0053461 [Helianthus annuus]KAJ0776902.1 hypothetical protein HanLR1_Chr02g0051041 [Helianthus annuus]KAJ0939519.1 hypothetical protein HanRHA438_Chr02g0062051 [Helianthus annuus]